MRVFTAKFWTEKREAATSLVIESLYLDTDSLPHPLSQSRQALGWHLPVAHVQNLVLVCWMRAEDENPVQLLLSQQT